MNIKTIAGAKQAFDVDDRNRSSKEVLSGFSIALAEETDKSARVLSVFAPAIRSPMRSWTVRAWIEDLMARLWWNEGSRYAHHDLWPTNHPARYLVAGVLCHGKGLELLLDHQAWLCEMASAETCNIPRAFERTPSKYTRSATRKRDERNEFVVLCASRQGQAGEG